jgi:hypothetical protein
MYSHHRSNRGRSLCAYLLRYLKKLFQAKTVAVIPLDNNEAAFSLAVVPFSARDGELHLVVGTAADTFLAPRSCSSGYLRTYKFIDDGAGLELHHKVCRQRFDCLIIY